VEFIPKSLKSIVLILHTGRNYVGNNIPPQTYTVVNNRAACAN